ncbi:MAG: AAA family ATPase [Anaerolineales bacterium]|nr:AAA family ATPase [Anaerolineales bacterium]
MAELSLFILGIPRLEREGRTLEVERHKAMALLAYLAVTGAPHRRDALAALLWPELDQTRARAALRRTLSALNVALAGNWLETSREMIGLSPSAPFQLDVAQFRQLLAQCRTHGHPPSDPCPDCLPLLAEATALYRGDFLSGFTLRDAPAFDDWQFFETETLRRELASALERLVHGYGMRRDYETAIRYARRWLVLDSLHELAHCQLMRLYAWAGQRNAALRQYAECVRLLERELGVRPKTTTTDLYTVIKENRLALPVFKHPSHHLPTAGEVQTVPENFTRPTAVPLVLTTAYSTLDRMARGQLVGRDNELAKAVALWQRATAGEGQVLLVSGEPGIGKTRLVRELMGIAHSAGARVLTENCHAEGGPPYAPLAGIIRDTFENPSDLALPYFILADLLTLAPHLCAYYPQIHPNPALGPEFEHQRMFDSFVGWCEILAATAPVLLLVEDIHWADGGTLALLRHLARRARKARLLMVLTYRDTEAEADDTHLLPPVLLDLNRERLAEAIRLARFTPDQTRALLVALLATAGDISPEFLESVYRETEGNPFFVEEVCKGLVEQGKLYETGGTWRRADMQTIVIPSSVRGAILARVERLPAPAQNALRLAAILGREFDFETLHRASEEDEDILISVLERAAQAQLIGETTRGKRIAYTFAHALIPFALREGLSGLRRQRLHRRVALAIEAQHPNDFESLAHHFAAAGEREKAIPYLRQAAERATASYAYDTAVQHLQSALDLLGTGGQIENRQVLLESLADVYRLRGERAEAITLYQEALRLGLELEKGEKWTAVRLHRKIGDTFNHLGKGVEIEQFKEMALAGLENGLKLIEDEPSHIESVRLLTALANYAYWGGYEMYGPNSALPVQGEHYAQAAVTMAEQLDAPVELSAALESLANLYSTHQLLREGVQIAQQRLALGRDPRFTNPREQVNILSQAGVALCAVGDYAQALIYLLEAERLADEIRDWGQVIYTLNRQIQCYFGLDRWEEILQIEEKRLALAERYGRDRIGRMCFQCGVSAYVHGRRGEMELARTNREEAYQMMATALAPENWLPIHHY